MDAPRTARPATVEENRLRLLSDLNAEHRSRRPDELELDARIASFEMAARMQLSAGDALDINQETAATQRLYGLDNAVTRPYATRCLMARRLVERGVRFVQIFMAGQPWDTHGNNAAQTRACCQQTDQPVGALLTDRPEVFYSLLPAGRGRGLATRAATALAAWALGAGYPQVALLTLPGNAASEAVARRAGFVESGEEAGEDGRVVRVWVHGA